MGKKKGDLFDNNSFQSKLIAKTRFIWYESVDEDPVGFSEDLIMVKSN